LAVDNEEQAQNIPYGDAFTIPFWNAAERGELLIQRCKACGTYQFYPRQFCLSCDAESPEWVPASGIAKVISKTTVRIAVTTEWEPPYTVAVVQLEEGPSLLTNLIGRECRIGDRVRVAWRKRQGEPPFPVFELEEK